MNKRLRALTVLTLFLTFDLIIFGAFTRLTDSGLGCPDWPGCYGYASPLGAQQHIASAQSAMPTGPVTHTKAWIEMLHRYLAMTVGFLILISAVASWVKRAGGRRPTSWWPTFTLAWVCLQGALGAYTVTMKLFPAIVTLHLLAGLVLLVLLQVQALRYDDRPAARMAPGLRAFLLLSFFLLVCQIALGAWVSTNYAVLACADFPRCQGQWWPAMDFRQGFTVWRELGSTGLLDGSFISLQALTAIHYAHRLAAYVVLTALALLAYGVYRLLPSLRSHACWLAALVLWQLFTGVANVVFSWPLLAAVAHTAGAAGLVLVLTRLVFLNSHK